MSCLITLTALCLVSPSEITLRVDASTQLAGDVRHWSGERSYGGGLLGHIGIEMPLVTARRFQLNAGYLHESLLNTRSDRGEERLSFSVVYRPFGGAR